MTTALSDPWPAPLASTSRGPLDALVSIPGSKSLSNRYLILAALGSQSVVLEGLLRSRDTELMMAALRTLGVRCEVDAREETTVTVTPPESGRFTGNVRVDCGLAGTVMRFVPALALYADGPVTFDGDAQAYHRPMAPLLDGLVQLGARVDWLGEEGFLPFVLTPPEPDELSGERHVRVDASSSSQFISGLLLAASRWSHLLRLTHTGETLPSMPHIRMTMADIQSAGGQVDLDMTGDTGQPATWSVPSSFVQLPSHVLVEPDLSNAAPFACAALIAGGTVRIPLWPSTSTQPGALLPDYLRAFGAEVSLDEDTHILTVQGTGHIRGVGQLDLGPAGEIAPTLAALATLADSDSTFTGIAHLRGHETDRLAALSTEIRRIGGSVEETADGLHFHAVSRDQLHGAVMETYADHRMATFAALLGLVIPGIDVVNVATTKKTIPDFVGMWTAMLGQENEA
ncbi:3-phosphoshikimate 1-carboxyvinyltransferase [Alloscardovia macacae]|uniref:3-phosphoshikimate 1-carboxyvinyltransferase n=1 Tax=Alloscardovia macacae TaxID=1160091 RepID=A0A261F5A9_9BIFI|nr:3-phosphoshikimate 1-carboxyvinyltransferase [Alloscardovia macacae]OZG54294.1 3-phosphoshikimate 1-carboxyvinyltransferase [Alloscardovia macacae]